MADQISGGQEAHDPRLVALGEAAASFWRLVDGLGEGRELSIAKTKIEEAEMWAAKHLMRQ